MFGFSPFSGAPFAVGEGEAPQTVNIASSVVGDRSSAVSVSAGASTAVVELFDATGGAQAASTPTTSWAALSNVAGTVNQNDNGAFSWNSSTATLTLPANDLPDAWLIIGAFKYEITHNNRATLQGRFVASGVDAASQFRTATTGGYARNSSEDSAFARTFAVLRNPTGGEQVTFQWKRDTGSGTLTGSVGASNIQAVQIWGDNFGL
jgi:hypothetical protein